MAKLAAALAALGFGRLALAESDEDRSCREEVLSRVVGGSEEKFSQLVDALQDLARVKFREHCFTWRLVPPIPAHGMPVGVTPQEIVSAQHNRRVETLEDPSFDIREDLSDMAVSMAEQIDLRFIMAANALVSTTAAAFKVDEALSFESLHRLDHKMAKAGYGLGLVHLPETYDTHRMREWACFGTSPYRKGYEFSAAPSVMWVQTVKTCVRPGSVYFFRGPIGTNVLERDVTVVMDRLATNLSYHVGMRYGCRLYSAEEAGHGRPVFDAVRFDYKAPPPPAYSPPAYSPPAY